MESPSNGHLNVNVNGEDPFSFEYYLNQSPEQKQEQSTYASLSHGHHYHFNREQHHQRQQSIQYHHQPHSNSPSDSQSSSNSQSPSQDEDHSNLDLDFNMNSDEQDFTSSYSSTLNQPFGTIPLSRSSSAHAFSSSNTLGLQGDDEMSLKLNNGSDGNGGMGSSNGGMGGQKMTYSESAPSFSFINPHSDRRDSFLSTCSSSPSTSSTLSLANSYSSSFNGHNSLNQHFKRANAVNYNNGGGSVSPASYISHPSLSLPSPCPSPLGLPSALSSISGLAIIDGSNGGNSDSTSSASSPQSQVNPLNHQQLLALSSDGENATRNSLGMPLELDLGMGDGDDDGSKPWSQRWWNNYNNNHRASPNSSRPTLGNALGLDSSAHMDQDEDEDMHGSQPSKRRAPPGVNDLEEALPSPARSTATEYSPAVKASSRPLGAILKRRATSSNVNEITPVALSRPSFAGQTSSAASDLIRHRHSISNTSHQHHPQHQVASHPQTPRNGNQPTNTPSSAISLSSTPAMHTPASSHSVTATPDYSTLSLSTPSSAASLMRRSSSYNVGSAYSQRSEFESPVNSMMPPRDFQRGQSYFGLAMGNSKCQELTDAPNSDPPVGLPSHLQFGRHLERVMDGSNEEHGLGIAGNGMIPLSPFRSPESRPSIARNYSNSSVSSHDPPRSAGFPSASFTMAHLAADSPARMQRSQSLGMGAPQSLPTRTYSTSTSTSTSGSGSSSSDSLVFSPVSVTPNHEGQSGRSSGLGYPFTFGTSVPSTPNAPTSNLSSNSYYTAPNPQSATQSASTSSGPSMKLTLTRPSSSRRKPPPPPLIVTSSGKQHACYCGKKFRRAEHLKRHQRAHTDDKPHACVLQGCPKAFGRSDNLAQHLKTHFKHLSPTKEELKRLMDDAKLFATTGAPSALAENLEAKEKLAAKVAPPSTQKKRAVGAGAKKRTSEGVVKEKKTGSKLKKFVPQREEQSWNLDSMNQEQQASPQRQALSPTGSAVANNSPPHFSSCSQPSFFGFQE